MGWTEQLIILALLSSFSPNMFFWATAGIARWFGQTAKRRAESSAKYTVGDVAVLIAAHNEETALPACLERIKLCAPASQIFVANDFSSDRTADIAREAGAHVFTPDRNLGKAKVLSAAVKHFDLCNTFKFILIVDSDSEIDRHYLQRALPVFDDEGIAAIAGHVESRRPRGRFGWGHLIHAYRLRLYLIMQTLYRYGQTWGPFDVTFCAPGSGSMYRTRVIEKLDMAANGLVIEDINMTFEVHKKKLGRIAYRPDVWVSTEDPVNLKDYSRQVKRWNLGLWQTIRKQGLWASKFWVALAVMQAETIFCALYVLSIPLLSIWALAFGGQSLLLSPLELTYKIAPIYVLWLTFFSADFLLTILAAVILRKPGLLLIGPIFPLFRAVDAFWTLATIPLLFVTKSDGRWASPLRVARKAAAP